MTQRSARPWLLGLLLIYLIMGVLVIGMGAMHLRPDENLVFDWTRRDLSFLVNYLTWQDSHPLLWFSSFWLWRQFVGDSEFAGRMLALFFSLITLSLVYRIGKRWLGAPRYGLFAIALLGVNSFFFIYALEIRPYGLIMLLGTVSMWTYQRWLTRQTWRSALFYALSLGVMLYVHYFLVVLMIVQALVFVLRRPTLRLIRQGLGVVTLAFLIWLPWLPFAINQMIHVQQAELIGGNARGLIGAGSTTQPTSWSTVLHLVRLATNGNLLLIGALLTLGLVYLWRSRNYRLVLAWAFAVPLVSLLLNLEVAIFLPRYIVYMVEGLALAAGAGLAVLPGRWRVPALVVTVGISLLTLSSQLPVRVPLRDLYQELSVTAQPGDTIYFDHGGLDDGFVQAQVIRYLHADLHWVKTLDEAEAARRVWYVSGDAWLSDAVRQRFDQIEQTHPLQQVIGQCDRTWCYVIQLLEAAPNPEPLQFGDSLAFWGMDLDHVDSGRIAARLWWSASEPPGLDYSIGLQLLNAEGQLVAQQDSAIADFYSGGLIQTSQMTPGKLYIDVRDITLPPELPTGDYQLSLVVYQSWDNVRLLLPDQHDALLLESIHLAG